MKSSTGFPNALTGASSFSPSSTLPVYQTNIAMIGLPWNSLSIHGGIQVNDFAGKGAEIFGPAFRIGAALDSGGALLVVSAVQEPLHRFGDALKAERPQALGEPASCRATSSGK
jgi:hypothetical protein